MWGDPENEASVTVSKSWKYDFLVTLIHKLSVMLSLMLFCC